MKDAALITIFALTTGVILTLRGEVTAGTSISTTALGSYFAYMKGENDGYEAQKSELEERFLPRHKIEPTPINPSEYFSKEVDAQTTYDECLDNRNEPFYADKDYWSVTDIDELETDKDDQNITLGSASIKSGNDSLYI